MSGLNDKELKELIKLLEWALEGNDQYENVGIGETDSDNLFKILDKLKREQNKK